MPDANQLALIHDYNDKYRKKFNPDLFAESDEGIIDELKKVVLSCQRESFFTIKVEGFEVIEDYETICQMMYEHEEKFRYRSKENQYAYINLKDSDIRLLVVSYYIAIKDESEHIKVLIATPRTVDRYYFRIAGNTYSALWQIVDASTYNSSTSSSKKHSVTLKTMFMPIRIYRYVTNHKNSLKDVYTGEEVKCTFYTSYIFKKSLPVMKYILAKFGYYGAAKFLHLDLLNIHHECPPMDNDMYVFNRFNLWISVPRAIFDKDQVMQSFVYTIYNCILKSASYREIFDIKYWLVSLASEFNNNTEEKGKSILGSFEFIYDLSTKDTLRLPKEMKENIYCVIKWIIGEFNNLKIKDNLNVSIKRIRRAEYIASLYAMKLSTAIYWLSDMGKKADISHIKKAIATNPMQLINAISSCQLINYRNFVGDLDSMVALKFTYKGISGIGEKNNSMPNTYRAVNPSHVGKVDLDASSAGDPGASGTLIPRAKIYSNGFFSDFSEPNTWEDKFIETVAAYKSLKGYKEALVASDKILNMPRNEDVVDIVDSGLITIEGLIKPIIRMSKDEEILDGFPLEESGLICYETLEEINDNENINKKEE